MLRPYDFSARVGVGQAPCCTMSLLLPKGSTTASNANRDDLHYPSELSVQPAAAVRRLLEFMPRTDREMLLDSDRAVRQVVAVSFILDFISRLREDLSPPCAVTGTRWMPDRAVNPIDNEMLRYFKFKRVIPVQLLQNDGLLFKTLLLDAIDGAPVVWLARTDEWFEFVGCHTCKVELDVVSCTLCTCGDAPLTHNQAITTHPDGRTARFHFVSSGSALVRRVDSAGRTVAHIAASLGHEHCLRMSYTMGVDVHQPDAFGSTPAHTAACNGHDACLRFLYSVGVPMTAADRRGETPMGLASGRGHDSCVHFLRAVVPPVGAE